MSSGLYFFRFPGSKSSSNLNQTFPFSTLEIAFWTLKTPFFFACGGPNFGGGVIFFSKISRASRGVIFFSDFDFGKVISGLYFFQISPEKCPSGLSRGGGVYLQEPGTENVENGISLGIALARDCESYTNPGECDPCVEIFTCRRGFATKSMINVVILVSPCEIGVFRVRFRTKDFQSTVLRQFHA